MQCQKRNGCDLPSALYSKLVQSVSKCVNHALMAILFLLLPSSLCLLIPPRNDSFFQGNSVTNYSHAGSTAKIAVVLLNLFGRLLEWSAASRDVSSSEVIPLCRPIWSHLSRWLNFNLPLPLMFHSLGKSLKCILFGLFLVSTSQISIFQTFFLI